MSTKVFKGVEQFKGAVEASLTRDYSAVIVRSAVGRMAMRRHNRLLDPGSPIHMLRQFLSIVDAEQALKEWADANSLTFGGFMEGNRVRGGVETHVDLDPYSVPLVMSLATHKRAHWRAQRTSGRAADSAYTNLCFNDSMPIDQFVQRAGDVVIVPSESMHQVTASNRRTAVIAGTRVLRYYDQAQTDETLRSLHLSE